MISSEVNVKKLLSKEVSKSIAEKANVSAELWQTGKTKIFLKDEALLAIQNLSDSIMRVKVILIQRFMLGYVYRKRYLRIQASIRLIQTYARGYVCRKRYRKDLRCVIIIQALIRGWFARDYVRSTKLDIQKKTLEASLENLGPVKMPTLLKPAKILSTRKPEDPFAGAIDLYKVRDTNAAISKEALALDDLFSFLGEFDPSNRRAVIADAGLLALMASNIIAEIEELMTPMSKDEALAFLNAPHEEEERVKLQASIEELSRKKSIKGNPLIRKNTVRNPHEVLLQPIHSTFFLFLPPT